MNTSNLARVMMLSSAVALALAATGADAQDAPAQASGADAAAGFGDILVTARKRDETSIAVPVVLTAIGGAELQARSITSLDIVGRLTPGLVIGEGGATAQGGNFGIRGIQGADTNLLGDQAVSFNLDGVQIAKAAVRRMSQMDIAQIEILKGPQALFYGKNSPGGIISVRSADPTKTFEAKLSAGYEAEAREFKGEGYVSGPITDTLGARFAFYATHMKGWIKYNIPSTAALQPEKGRDPLTKEIAGRLTLKYDPTDQFDARLKISYNKVTGNPGITTTEFINCPGGAPLSRTPGLALVADCKANGVSQLADIPDAYHDTVSTLFDKDNALNNRQLLVGLELNYHPTDDLTLTSVTGFYRNWYDATFMSSATYDPGSLLPNHQQIRDRQIMEELRVTSSYDGPVNFTFGGFFQDVKASTFNVSGQSCNVAFAPSCVSPVGVPLGPPFDAAGAFNGASFFWNQDTTAYSAFGQVRWNIFPTLELAAGGRYSYEKKTLGDVFTGLLPKVQRRTTDLVNPLQLDKVTFNDFSPEVSLSYRPTDQLTVFGSYRRGFLSGGFNTGSANVTSGLAYDQETVKGFEAGVKALLLDGSLRTNLSAYTYEAKGIQLSVTTRNGVVELRNAGSARIKGLEWDANYRTPLEGFYLRGAVAYNHARYTDYIASCIQGQPQPKCILNRPGAEANSLTQDLKGEQLLRAPDWQGNVGFTFDTPISEGLKFGLTGDMTFSSNYFTDAGNDVRGRMPSFRLFNATVRVAQADDQWEVALIGRNLGNKYYWVRSADRAFTAAGTGGLPGTTRLSDKLANIQRGREIFLRFSVKFGQ